MNERESTMLRGILVVVVLIAAAILLTTCGGGNKRAVVQGLCAPEASLSPGSSPGTKTSPEGLPAEAGLDYRELISLDEALAEIDAYPCPEDVDAELFAELKDALGEALHEQWGASTSRSGVSSEFVGSPGLETDSPRGMGKLTSTPPTGDENRVNDLAITDNGDGTYTLSWHYRNLGDYDQNGTVGISDITPIAMHYNEIYNIEDENCLLAVIDGSGNGVVDIADITPLAMNYGVECVGYNVEGSDSATGSFNFIQEAPLNEATGDGRVEFSSELDELSWGYYRVVPYDGEGIEGIPSNVVSVVPTVYSVSPQAGATGTEVAFIAEIDGLLPLTYAWNFGGGASPNTTNESEPTVTLVAPGSYSASLIVANACGSDSYDFTLNVELPPAITSVTPSCGEQDEPITFTAVVEGSPPFMYSWDFGGGATPNVSEEVSPQVILGAAGEYSVSLTVTNDYGEDTYDFTIIVCHVLTVLTVDSAGDVGWYTSLAIVNGNPAIGYYDISNADLKYVRASDASGSSWEGPITVDSAGYDTSLAVVNGNPAISYRDVTNDDLKYVRASDASGGSWGTPQTVDSAGDVGRDTSLAIVNGNPAISYYDHTNIDLKYVRASDASGGSWGTPVIVDSAGNSYTCLAVVNGNPAISYKDWPNNDLKYVRASDANGGSWGSPVTVDSAGDVGYFTSLAVVNGKPAISYFDLTNCNLKYVRASDASGGSWGTPQTVDSAGDVGRHTSLAVVNGNPAISYCDQTKGDLKYVRASDASGGSWGTPVILDSAGFVGWWTSLAVINGDPAISYSDHTNGDLKFATYY